MKTPDTRITKCSFSICESSWSGPCCRLNFSYPAIVRPISNTWDSVCLFNTPMLFLTRSVLHSFLRISDFVPASNFSFFVNPKWSWSDRQLTLDKSYVFVSIRQRSVSYLLKLTVHLETNLLHWSDKFASDWVQLRFPWYTVTKQAHFWCARRQS